MKKNEELVQDSYVVLTGDIQANKASAVLWGFLPQTEVMNNPPRFSLKARAQQATYRICI